MHQMALAIIILLLVGTMFVLVLRFVRSRFLASSDLDDSDISDSDEPEDGDWLDDPHSGSPALLKGGPKRKITAAEAEGPE
jgi:hypothetical protein